MRLASRSILLTFCFLIGAANGFAESPDTSGTVVGSSSATLMTSEHPSSFLENLPPPVPVPPNIHLPAAIVEKDQWRGSRCGIVKPVGKTFRSTMAWKEFWTKAIAPYDSAFNTIPDIDFSKEMVVGVFRGEMSTPGYGIRIVSTQVAHSEAGNYLKVSYQKMNPFLGVFNPPFPVQPFHLRRVPFFAGKVHYVEVRPSST